MTNFTDLAEAYISGVQALAEPLVTQRGLERGGASPELEPAVLVAQVEQLADVSAKLTDAAMLRLADGEADVRAETEMSLLAKALTDLEVSTFLYRAAAAEDLGGTSPASAMPMRADASVSLGQHLGDLLPKAAAQSRTIERAAKRASDIPTARAELTQNVQETLELIQTRAAKAGQTALSSLASLGASELAQAAGIVGRSIASALGQAEKVTRLYELFRRFALNAYESLLALLGPTLAAGAAKEVVAWVGSIVEGEKLEMLLERWYETKQTTSDLGTLAEKSAANLAAFASAIQGVNDPRDPLNPQKAPN